MKSVLIGFYYYIKKNLIKINLEKKGFIYIFGVHIIVHHDRKTGQELSIGTLMKETEAETMEKH